MFFDLRNDAFRAARWDELKKNMILTVLVRRKFTVGCDTNIFTLNLM